MNENNLKNWLKTLGDAWTSKNPDLIGSICADDVKYYENPFEAPRVGRQAVISEWQNVPNSQRNITFNFDIIGITDGIGIAHWHASFTRIPEDKIDTLDGIFTIKLNENEMCTEFHMWWVVKNH
jgi:hypothetical protein